MGKAKNGQLPEPIEGQLTFEERILDEFQAAIMHACEKCPELRQVAVIFDWSGQLNQGAQPFVIGNATGPLVPTARLDTIEDVQGMMSQFSKAITYLANTLYTTIGMRERVAKEGQVAQKAEGQPAEA